MKINLFLRVSANGLPADFIVRDFNGNIVFYRRRINAFNHFTFCTRSKNLIFTVRPYNTEYAESSKFLKFPCAKCVCSELFYDFPINVPVPIARNDFTLTDFNYSFPIPSAMLLFTNL